MKPCQNCGAPMENRDETCWKCGIAWKSKVGNHGTKRSEPPAFKTPILWDIVFVSFLTVIGYAVFGPLGGLVALLFGIIIIFGPLF
jgi:uncharacterized membrane protein YvbJ